MKENGFEYVDLGLESGTMWATCNVGADKPEDSGLLFQFGVLMDMHIMIMIIILRHIIKINKTLAVNTCQ